MAWYPLSVKLCHALIATLPETAKAVPITALISPFLCSTTPYTADSLPASATVGTTAEQKRETDRIHRREFKEYNNDDGANEPENGKNVYLAVLELSVNVPHEYNRQRWLVQQYSHHC